MRLLFSFLITGMLFVNGNSQNSFFSHSSRFGQHYLTSVWTNSSLRYARDSSMNGFSYSVLVRTDTSGIVELFRESNDSIFRWNAVNQIDLLWYDFNLQTGDAINLPVGTFVADTVSMVTDLALQQRRYIHLHHLINSNFELRWIYGVGDINYGLTGYYDFEILHEFICASDSSGLIWLASYPYAAAECDSLCEIPEIKTGKMEVAVFPIPSSTSVSLKWNNKSDFDHIILTTLAGQIVKSKEVNENQIEMDVSHLAEGIYFYTLTGVDGKSLSGKLIVEHY